MLGKKLRRLIEVKVNNNIFKGLGYKEVKYELGKHMAERDGYTVQKYVRKGAENYLPNMRDMKEILEIFGTTAVNDYNIYSKGVYLEINRMYRYLHDNGLWETFFDKIEDVIIHKTLVEYMYIDSSKWGYLQPKLYEAVEQGTDIELELTLWKGENVVQVGNYENIHIDYTINLKNIHEKLYGITVTKEQFEKQLLYVLGESIQLQLR